MSDLTNHPQSHLFLALLFNGLRVTDSRLNEIAAEYLTRFGSQPVQRLVLVATGKRNSLGYRLRALEVIQRIVRLTEPNDFFDLNILLTDRNERIRKAVGKVLVKGSS